MEIQGKFATAVCYARIIEGDAIEQIRTMCDQEFARGSRIRIMPDVHVGKSCTIGTTMTVGDKVVPNLVGVDIGCGMYTVKLAERDIDFARFDEAAHFIPSGINAWDRPLEDFDLAGLRCFRNIRVSRLMCTLGTLGGGNHFIELERSDRGDVYLVIHTGSRNMGKQVAELYQKLAVELNQGRDEYYRRKDSLIAEYKAAGRQREIQAALRALAWSDKPLTLPAELCYLYGSYLDDYLHDVEICQRFARRNRELIAEILLERAGLTATDAFHTVHNYIDVGERILRKGAIAAHAGERVLIPINMRDGSILAVGRGNPEWNFSAPHGAGRVLSRSRARETLSMEDYRDAMRGVYTTSVNPQTLDESPMAYKSLADILDVVRESVDVLELLKPIYNFKASD